MTSIAAHRIAFGDRIRDLRKAKGWAPQEDFAHHAGLARTYISEIERARRNPTLDVFIRLARALEVPPAKLLAIVDEPEVNR